MFCFWVKRTRRRCIHSSGTASGEEMKHEASSYTLNQLREMHQVNMEETSTPMLTNLVYRLFALETYHEFEAELNK